MLKLKVSIGILDRMEPLIHKKIMLSPCGECPYQKRSLPGYMGGHDPEDYRAYINMDRVVPCHTRSQYDEEGEPLKVSPCTGHVASVVKSCRQPLPSELRELTDAFRKLPDADKRKDDALASWEFLPHHEQLPIT